MGTLRTEVRNPFALLMRERARAAAWWLNSARRSSLLNLLSTRPGRSGYKPHSPISRPNVLNHIATASPTTDLCLVRGLRPPGRNPCTKCPQSHRHRTSTRASRAALPGGGHERYIMVRTFLPPSAGQTCASPAPNPTTTHLPQENRACFTCWRPDRDGLATTPSPHQQAQRPQPHCHSSTHSGPLTSSGAPRPGQQHAKPCCGPPTSPNALQGHQASGRGSRPEPLPEPEESGRFVAFEQDGRLVVPQE
jgi:hypothetical protein